jgi:hypothetical protein
VNASEATNGRSGDNGERSETRVLSRYGAREDEHTKPSVMLLDWNGEEEVTVRWETVRRDAPATVFRAAADASDFSLFDDDYDFDPPRFRGIGGHAGSVILGVVLGAAVAIGVCAIFAPAQQPAASSEGAVAVAPH